MIPEIKFRAKRITGGWIESLTIAKGTIKRKRDEYFMEIEPTKWVGIIPETLGQFFHKKDKNGVDIFTGDIIRLTAKSHSKLGTIDKEWITVVVYDKNLAQFLLHNIERNLKWAFSDRDFNGVLFVKEVIGNIHENADLIS